MELLKDQSPAKGEGAVPEQESRIGLARSEACSADPHVLQQPQVCDLVATVALVQLPSHLVLIGLDAADIEGLLWGQRTLGEASVTALQLLDRGSEELRPSLSLPRCHP